MGLPDVKGAQWVAVSDDNLYFVRETLPQVLALEPSKERAFNAAVTLVGEGRIAAITHDWMQSGDVTATANALDTLVAKAPESWDNREAVGLFATRMRKQEAAPRAEDPDAKQTAEFLMTLSMDQIAEFPLGNWLIPQRDEQQRYVRGGGFPGASPFAKAGGKAKTDARITAFLGKKREALITLAKLLDDRRFLRVDGRRDEHAGAGRCSHDGSELGATIGYRYDQLARPWELGELVWRILNPLLPEEVRWGVETNPENRAKLTSGWLKAIVAMNDEDLAWYYLHAARRPDFSGFHNMPAFLRSLDFLTETGGPETLTKIKDVLLDSGVWENLSFDEMILRVEAYLKRAPRDDLFPEKLRAAVKAGLDTDEDNTRRYLPNSITESARKQMPVKRAALAKLLDRALQHPGRLAEKFTALATMDQDERTIALQSITAGLAIWPPLEVEAALLQTVASVGSQESKRDLIRFLLNSYEPKSLSTVRIKYDDAFPIPTDAPTREAMLALLCDETPFADNSIANGRSTLADFTATVLFSLGTGGARRDRWESLSFSARHLTTQWMRAQAMAIASGKRPPPLPNPAKVSARKTSALLRQLGALPPAQVPAALAAKSLDEQVAIVARLDRVERWPAPLMMAHFTVGKISGDKAGDLGAAAWLGLRLDEKLIGEITAAVQKAAITSKHFTVTAAVAGSLSGCEIAVVESPNTMTPQQHQDAVFPGLLDKPMPVAVCLASIQERYYGIPEFASRFGFPVWSDEAVTTAWRSECGMPQPGAKTPDRYSDQGGKQIPANPAAFDEEVSNCLSLGRYQRDPLRLTISATGIGKGQ